MSSFDKVVKLACKPKAAAPKAKYLDTIIAATYSEDGAVNDVCRALSPKFKEPNAIIVFKALIVLHTMVRNGATDNVLAYLSSQPSDVLRLRNVSNGQWEGYSPPQNLSNYALYLDCRIRSYKELKHDTIRVQSESNRDLRVGAMDAETRRASGSTGTGVQRSKTVMGRKLRVMTVEKGLLRETKIVQKLVDVLLDCQFYLDDLEDELILTALRMLVKDMLVLFQAVNEGVINVLEHYFEMSKVDASAALGIYRTFCRQTERVVEYLTMARKLQNLLNVPIPNLKHAPVSLVNALEEYLNDPNFEQNRIEYKLAKEQAETNAKNPKSILKKSEPAKAVAKPAAEPASASSATASAPAPAAEAKKPEVNKDLMDFFSSIETEQSHMFNTNSPTAPTFSPSIITAQATGFNPFMQRQSVMVTGVGATGTPFFGPSPFANLQTGVPGGQQASPFVALQPQMTAFPGLQAQATGFPNVQTQVTGFPNVQTQATGFPASQSQPNGLLAPGNATSPFLRPQSAAGNFLQPQATGMNPFRLSMLNSNPTGASPFALPGNMTASASTPFANATSPTSPFGTTASTNNILSVGASPISPFALASAPASATSPFSLPPSNTENAAPSAATHAPFILRPASTPAGTAASPLIAQQTGSRNPFGKPKSPPPPPVPPVPTLGELSAGKQLFGGAGSQINGASMGSTSPFGQIPNSAASPSQVSPFAAFGIGANSSQPAQSAATANGGNMSSIASAFALPSTKPSSPPPFGAGGSIGGAFGSNSPFAPLAAQQTSSTINTSSGAFSAFSPTPTGTSTTSMTAPSLQAQPTGFGGSAIKPFKPSSSFGASLLEALPTIPQENDTSVSSNPTGLPGTAAPSFGALNASAPGTTPIGGGQSSGANLFGGLQPQATGANPFRATIFGSVPSAPLPSSTLSPTAPSSSPFPFSTPTALGSGVNNGLMNPSGATPSLLQAQPTGLKAPFKPSSAFGASLLANMGPGGATSPAMPGAFPSTPTAPQQNQQPQNPVSLI